MDSEKILRMRDAKTRSHLEQYAPVWIVNENVAPQNDSVTFDVVFQTQNYGWVNRRYTYDAFNDVLYHLGETLVGEDKIIEIQAQQVPYIEALVSDIPNSYGG
jgi:hypothetical protein